MLSILCHLIHRHWIHLISFGQSKRLDQLEWSGFRFECPGTMTMMYDSLEKFKWRWQSSRVPYESQGPGISTRSTLGWKVGNIITIYTIKLLIKRKAYWKNTWVRGLLNVGDSHKSPWIFCIKIYGRKVEVTARASCKAYQISLLDEDKSWGNAITLKYALK